MSNINLLNEMKIGKHLTTKQQIMLIAQLSLPAILAQISTIVMEYIDASMVGHLGANASASIGLMSSSTWLLGGLCGAASTGFTVLVAHNIGAQNDEGARNIVRQGLFLTLIFSLLLAVLATPLSFALPTILGGNGQIRKDATRYFMVYALAIPIMQLNNIAGGMLQCSGNMKVPSLLHVLMCALDVLFNLAFIFGLNMGVFGAALGTMSAELVVALIMLYFLLVRSKALHLRKDERLKLNRIDILKALKISVPIAIEQVVICGAYIMSTVIVAPLGNIAIAAHSFAITAESLCYMPGYGLSAAATTIVGQCTGAGRKDLVRRFGLMTVGLGMGIMLLSGILMYVFAPWMIGVLTPNNDIRSLGTTILRIEAFAEPLYGASIVATGVLRGVGNSKVPSIINLVSMWLVRIPASAILARKIGLRGVWIAMCVELCVRGILYLVKIMRKEWK